MSPTPSVLPRANHRRAQYSLDSNSSILSESSYRRNSASSSIYSTDDAGPPVKPFKRVRFEDELMTGSFFDFDSESESSSKSNILRRTYRKSPILSIPTNTSTEKATSTPSSPNESPTGTKLRSLMSLRLSRSYLSLKSGQDEKLVSSDNDILSRAARSARHRRIGPISKPIYSEHGYGDGLAPHEMI